MRAFGYLVAGAALLITASAQLLKSPAPNSALGNGWRYQGCYSDNKWDLPVDHALDGSFTRLNPNGGVSCTATCRTGNYKYAGTKDDECWCGNVINPNNSFVAGIPALLGSVSCQTGCRGNTGEACGTTNLYISIYTFT